MKSLSVVFLVFLTFFILPDFSFAQVSVNPFGLTVSLEQDAETDIELTLTNSGDENVAFRINYEAISDEEEQLIGPRRDEPGEILAELAVPYYNTVGLAWDPENQWMWALAWSDSRLYAYDIENEETVVNVAVRGILSLFYVDGVLYAGGYNNNVNTVYRFDTQGNAIGNWRIQTDLTWTHIGGDENYIYTITYPTGGGEGDVHVFEFQDNAEEIAVIDCNEWIGDDGYGVESIPDHRRGHLWLSDRENMYQFSVDDEWNANLVQQFETVNSGHCGLAHDGVNLWRGIYDGETRMWYMIDDGELESLGFIVDPISGVIPANDSETIGINISSVNCEVGVYNVVMNIELTEPEQERDEFEPSSIEISVVLSIGEPTYSLSGVVTNAENDHPIESAFIQPDCYSIIRTTNEEGAYSIENLPPGVYDFTYSAVDYLPTIEAVEIGEVDVERNVALLHSECTPSQNQFFMQLQPGDRYEFNFRVDNGGNGPLTYSAERRLLGDANADPFELRQSDEIQEVVGDDMLAGVVYIGDNFYVSGGNNGDNPNKIYVLNTDKEVVREFDQFVNDRYGMRDLAYDGELIWGAVEGTFYGFNTDGDLINTFSVDVNLEGRALAWDPVDQVLLASDISTDIFAINRDGDVVETYQRPDELRIYGLGVWPDDPGGYYLYVFCRGPDNIGIDAFKLDPASGEYMLAAYFDVGDSRPSGIQITNQLDVYSWVIVALVQNPDILNVWQLAARKEWFQITPAAGVIEPDEHDDFVLTLDATGLPTGNEFCGEIVFTHDGEGAETILDVTLSVEEGRVQTTRDINLHIGWNTISANLQPNDNENIEGLVADLVENDLLIMMKNGNGDFYRPDYEFNSISAWNSWEGFQMLMSGAATLSLEGESMLFDDPIELTAGWNLISYYPRIPVDAITALHDIIDYLIIAKDGHGNFFLPEWDNFSNMGDMCPGQGYYVNVSEDCVLRYVTAIEEERLMVKYPPVSRTSIPSIKVEGKPACHEDQIWLLEVPRSSASYSLLLLTEGVESGTHLEAYTPSGELAGRGVVDDDGRCGMALWGNESGFSNGEVITVKVVGRADIPPCGIEGRLVYHDDLEWLDGDISGWKADGWGVAKLTGLAVIPKEFGIISAYPNPFNSQMRVIYSILETGIVDLAVYDVSGRRVAELSSGRQAAGNHTIMFDGANLSSGVYMLRLCSDSQNSMMKVIMIK
ncbi:T9SS type A sorting domain-containing protein [bacterium]|nr:T9SS type A sorting domain-containing protein [bacterium]